MPVARTVLSWRQMGNMEVEEVIERHLATLLMQDQVRGQMVQTTCSGLKMVDFPDRMV